jgi:hypothetical protein
MRLTPKVRGMTISETEKLMLPPAVCSVAYGNDKRSAASGKMRRVKVNFERRPVDRRPVWPGGWVQIAGDGYKYYCYSLGNPIYPSVGATSHGPEELVGHIERLERSLFFRISGRSSGRTTIYIADPRRTRQGAKPTCSCRNTRPFYYSFGYGSGMIAAP